jgi:hypothetical protein
MRQEDEQGSALIKKPTGFMTNAPCLADRLSRPCTGDHRHILLMGGRAKRAEIYPGELCREIIIGLSDQMRMDGRLSPDGIGSMDMIDEPAHLLEVGYVDDNYTYWDDLSGKPLDKAGVNLARAEEMEEFKRHGVYVKVPITECRQVTGKEPIGVKWIDINKGDDVNPELRSRLVAQEIKRKGSGDTIFAATPPLEAKKALFSFAVTEDIGWGKDWQYKLEFIDVKRAYFYAEAKRNVYVKLPDEDFAPGMCGKLLKSMYGTRDAAFNWEEEYSNFMINCGFTRGISSPCVFYHKAKDIRAVIYGDDFTLLGADHHLDWFRKTIQDKYRVSIKGRLGPGEHDSRSVRLLNRVIEWDSAGIKYEPDLRHAEIVIQQLELEDKYPLSTPGTRWSPKDVSEHDLQELEPEKASNYRALVARCNYLSQDRSDIRFAVKELCRKMSKPRNIDWDQLVRFGRYLRGRMRVVTEFNYQKDWKIMDVWSDTDHAGCLETRKSTSGGVMIFGSHVIKQWATTQGVVSLSSGEAEYYGCVRAGSQALGMMSLIGDLGVGKRRIRIKTDASVAKSLAARRGLGGIKHIEVNQLWLQGKVNVGEIEIEKVDTSINRADPLTKYKDQVAINNHLKWTFQFPRSGRHEIMPKLCAADGYEIEPYQHVDGEDISAVTYDYNVSIIHDHAGS